MIFLKGYSKVDTKSDLLEKRFEYLAYQIIKEHDNKYIESVAFDIQKERKHKNIIILVDNINRIDLNYFSFGNNRTKSL